MDCTNGKGVCLRRPLISGSMQGLKASARRQDPAQLVGLTSVKYALFKLSPFNVMDLGSEINLVPVVTKKTPSLIIH